MLSEKLTDLRRELKKTQAQVALEIGIGRSAYAMYEQGQREPDFDMLKKLAEYYGVTTDYLLGQENNSDLKTIVDMLQLMKHTDNDDEIVKKYTFILDDMVLTEEEAREFISYVRLRRVLRKQEKENENK